MLLGRNFDDLDGKLTDPICEGTALISSTKITEQNVIDAKIILTKLSMNNYLNLQT